MRTGPIPPPAARWRRWHYGVPEPDIARVVGVDAKTLRKHYRDELPPATSSHRQSGRVPVPQGHQRGTACVNAAIFWLKTCGGWRETPQEHKVRHRSIALSDEELERMIAHYQAEIDRQEGRTLTLTANLETVA